MHSTESSENYLETILILSKKLPVVRSVDIANELGFKKSSVSIAMKNLREKNQRETRITSDPAIELVFPCGCSFVMKEVLAIDVSMHSKLSQRR